MKFSSVGAGLAAGMFFSSILGCGGVSGPKAPEGPKGSAKATVVYDGKPIKVGTLVLDSGKGYMASAPASADGKFALKGPNGAEVPAGAYKVGITPPPAPIPALGASSMSPPAKIDGLPEKFYDPSSSGVSVEIKPGKQDLEIVLK
jgi:hypothetical protein